MANYSEIIKNNSKQLYKISKKKYPYLYSLFQNDKKLRKLYFSLMNYMEKVDMYKYNYQKSFHISTKQITKIRKATGNGTASRYMNFLCAMGLIRKHTQDTDPQNTAGLTKINKDFMKGKPEKYRPINTFYIYSLGKDGKRLEEIEERCKRLSLKGITKGNISKAKLEDNDLYDIAEEILSETFSSSDWDIKSYRKIFDYLQSKIQEKGYATKKDIYENVILNREKNVQAIDKVLSHMSVYFHEDLHYSRPTAEEKEKYNLKSERWIIRPYETEEH